MLETCARSLTQLCTCAHAHRQQQVECRCRDGEGLTNVCLADDDGSFINQHLYHWGIFDRIQADTTCTRQPVRHTAHQIAVLSTTGGAECILSLCSLMQKSSVSHLRRRKCNSSQRWMGSLPR